MSNNDCDIPITIKILGVILAVIVVLYFVGKFLGYVEVNKFLKDHGSLVGAVLGAIVLTCTVVYTINSQSKYLEKQLKSDRDLADLAARGEDVNRIREYLVDMRMQVSEYCYHTITYRRELYYPFRWSILRSCNSISSITKKMRIGEAHIIDVQADAAINVCNFQRFLLDGDINQYEATTNILINGSKDIVAKKFFEDCKNKIISNGSLYDVAEDTLAFFFSQNDKMTNMLGYALEDNSKWFD